MLDQPVMRIRDLQKRFGRLEVLRGVDLDLHRGEILALVGENGAGKSTIVQCIAKTTTADRGVIEIGGDPLAPEPVGVRDQRVAVVWQDLALCDNLSVVANLFLGDEMVNGRLLDEARMVAEATAVFEGLPITVAELHRPVRFLSGGQRQLIAIARATRKQPLLLVLDEPTASLGVAETAAIERQLVSLRATGTTILLVSHRLEQVFGLADRVAVLREGRVVAAASTLELHPDDVVAMMSGVATVSSARRQLRRLRSLVDQLAETEPAASLPLIVSAMADALGIHQLCVHRLHESPEIGPRLRRSAAVGLTPAMLAMLDTLPVGPDGGPPGVAAATGAAVVVEDTRRDPFWTALGTPTAGVLSSWSVPIVGSGGVLGAISGFAETVGRPQSDQLELISLYAGHAAAAIEREGLLAEATRRNRILETMRGVIDKLAGPQAAEGGLAVALVALCRGLGADAISLHHAEGECSEFVTGPLDAAAAKISSARQRQAAQAILLAPGRLDRARPVGPDVLAVPITSPAGRAVVTAWWSNAETLSNDALDLLDDAARSLQLALEREALERANAEAASLRKSQHLQREFLFLLNHELRTPLTAIQGYASTLSQPDVSWDTSSQQRFLESIASESARMGRLVGDLLDFSAIDSGTLRLVRDWCRLDLVLEAARRCVTEAPASLIQLQVNGDLPAIWADHDRLEQVFVNLLDNAVRHATGLTRIWVTATMAPTGDTITVRVADDGQGIDPALAERIFEARERGDTGGAGLGLAIARGIVVAHAGVIELEPAPTGVTIAVTIPVEAG